MDVKSYKEFEEMFGNKLSRKLKIRYKESQGIDNG